MSKKSRNPGPVPADKKADTDADFEEPGQDESGKTSAPLSEQGPGQKREAAPDKAKKREEPRPM